MAKTDEIKLEQTHFDKAADAREQSRRTLSEAHGAAAGNRAAASAVRRGALAAAEKLGNPHEPVAFAMFKDVAGECLYLGKHAISDAQRDLLVINWQADAAAPYFQASYDDPCGVASRRKFSTDRNIVLDFDEVVFADLARAVGDLTESERSGIDDTVLRDLEQDRTGEMRDIVQTIQAAQYQLIRSSLDQLLVVQGGPGTGKTAVALHRVSWLLFNHLGSLRPDDVLVVGPNPTFTRYIRAVLPGLGDADVHHRDLRSLGPVAASSRHEEVDVLKLKGSERMADLLATALRLRVRFPTGTDEIEVGPPARASKLTRGDVETQLRRNLNGSPNYMAGRAGFRAWVTDRVTNEASPAQIDAAVDRVWPSLTPQMFLRDLFGSRERLVAAAGDDFTAGDVSRLMRAPAARLTEETWSDADVALLDEAEQLITGGISKYKHIVVDEAQDLSPMQLRSVRRRSTNGSMTVVGDIAQSTGPWTRESWADVVQSLQQELPANVDELTLGYRVPEQIYALAAQLLPEAAPNVTPPRIIRKGPAEPTLLRVSDGDRVDRALVAARDYAGRGLFVGLICPDTLREELEQELRTLGMAWSDASKGNLSKSINVLSAEESKGLEFDAVIVLEPEDIAAESDSGLRLLYVALTRSTRYLTVSYSGSLIPTKGAVTGPPEERMPPMVESHAEPPEALIEITGSVAAASRAPGDTGLADRAEGSVVEPAVAQVETTPLPHDSPTTPTAASTGSAAPVSDLAVIVSESVAQSLAASVRQSVAPALWPFVVDRLRRELEVTDMDLLDLMGE